MYMKNPMGIEQKSMEIIDSQITNPGFDESELLVAKRMIHTTGDVDYMNIIRFQHDFVDQAKVAMKQGGTIFTDTNMALAGINKKALAQLNLQAKTYISDPRVAEMAKNNQTTRSSSGVDLAVEDGIDMFVVGNAPTALYRILEHVKEGKLNPRFIIGVPVGFVGAAESKAYLREFDIPTVTTEGCKGGSNVAASIINALMYMMVDR